MVKLFVALSLLLVCEAEPSRRLDDADCSDDPEWYHKNRGPDYDCAWVALKTDTRCSVKGVSGKVEGTIVASEGCKAACGGCGGGGGGDGDGGGCGDEVCAGVIPITSKPFPKIESGTCYVVAGTLFNGMIPDVTDILLVRNVVNCAKIAVPSGSGLRGMSVDGDNAEVVIQGKVNFVSVSSSADEAKITITGTGTYLADGPVTIAVSSPTTEITVSDPGKAVIGALGGVGDITFKCYGEDVTVPDGESAVCLPPTAAPTAVPSSNGLP